MGRNRIRVVRWWRAALVSVAALVATVAPDVGLSSMSEAATPVELGAVTNGCATLGLGLPGDNYPIFTVTLYNMQGTPSASATVSRGTVSVPLPLGGPTLNQSVPGSYSFDGPDPLPSLQPVVVSVAWTDSAGGKTATFQQLVGVPNCNVFTRTATPAVGLVSDPTGSGYWITTSEGAVQGFGHAYDFGDMSDIPLNAPIVSLAATADGNGYWLLGRDGGVFSFGDAQFYGSTGSLRLNAPVVAMAATPDGGGYWFVANDGGVFAYGDAPFYGSMGGRHLNAPIVGMAVDQATGGYWLVASDGGIFSFNAPFRGSAGSLALHSPIVGMQASPDGGGYRLAASDGGVFAYLLPFAGSDAGMDPHPVVGVAGAGSTGYWLLNSCGGIYSFGTAQFYGAANVC